MHHAICMRTNRTLNPGQPGIIPASLQSDAKRCLFSVLFYDPDALVTQPGIVTVSGSHNDLLACSSLLGSS